MSDVSTASSSPKRPLRILSVDGGGIRGIIPLHVLVELERQVKALHGKALHEVFDFFAGTSTGGMIVSALCAKSTEEGIEPATAEDILADYVNHGPDIFPSSFGNRLSTGWGWARRKYSHDSIVKMIRSRVGKCRLRDTAVELLLTSYDMHTGQPYFFKRWRARQDPQMRDHPLWEAVRSTSAAPTFFEPHNLASRDGSGQEIYNRCLVDGGLIANNPAMCAWAEAQKMLQIVPEDPDGPRPHLPFDVDERQGVLLVSLGTGDMDARRNANGTNPQHRRYQFSKVKNWWKGLWAGAAIEVSMDGVADTVEHQLNHILIGKDEAAQVSQVTQSYFRFQSHITKATEDMDVANAETIAALQELGRDLASSEKDKQIKSLAAMLD